MPEGKGRYGDLCEFVRLEAQADGAIVIIINGNRGSGFSVQADGETLALLPETLEEVARGIRADRERLAN